MVKKHQKTLTFSIYIILLLLTLPGYYLLAKEKSDNSISFIILIFLQLFILLYISIAIKNIIISFIIETFSNESNSLPCEIIYGKNFSMKKFQSLSKIFVILIILSGYCLVCIFLSLPYMAICSSVFISVYSLSINIVPNRILFFNNDCIIHNKINNIFFSVKSYSIEGCNCTLFLSDKSKYHVIIENTQKADLIKKFESANITHIS